MTRRFGTAGWLGFACLGLLAACTTVDGRVQQHERQLHSLASTTTLVGKAWLERRVSAAYAATALEQTLVLVERERAALGGDADVLRDQAGGRLSEQSEQLARRLATMVMDVRRGNGMALREQLAAIPLTSMGRR